MLNYTQISNISAVDFNGARLWAHFILIDEQHTGQHAAGFMPRQIRGFTVGGLPVFTFWIGEKEVQLQNSEGGQMVMLGNDGEVTNLDKGLVIIAGDLKLWTVPANHRMPQRVKKISVQQAPGGPEIDKEHLEFYPHPAYPLVVYMLVEKVKEIRKDGFSF